MATKNNYGKNMMMITSFWGNNDTFKLIPATDDCPYAEVIYDPNTTLLVVISKLKKENYSLIPVVDSDGNPIKTDNPKNNGTSFKEEQVKMNVFQEYFIPEYKEQLAFIKDFAVNFDTYNYKRFLRNMETEPKLDIPNVEKQPLVDANGAAFKMEMK